MTQNLTNETDEVAIDFGGEYDNLAADSLFDGDWEAFLTADAFEVVGEPLFSVIIVGCVVLPLYLRSGRADIPAILLALLSGTLIPMLPGNLVGVAWGVFWIALTIGLIGLFRNFR